MAQHVMTFRVHGMEHASGADGGAVPEDLLMVDKVRIEEALSRPSLCRVALVTRFDDELENKLATILGRTAVLTIDPVGGRPRHYHGHIRRFDHAGQDARYTHYIAELVPWPWFLGLRRNCRIFQFMTAGKIVLEEIFNEWRDLVPNRPPGFADYSGWDAADPEKERDYCVQYRETDLAFVTRLMIEEGRGWYIQHEEDGHTMVINSGSPIHEIRNLRFGLDEVGSSTLDVITDWRMGQELVSGGAAVRGYHFENARNGPIDGTATTLLRQNDSEWEDFVYPNGFHKPFIGKGQAGSDRVHSLRRMAEFEASYSLLNHEHRAFRVLGAGTCTEFAPGYVAHIEPEAGAFHSNFYDRIKGQYLLTAVTHTASGGSFPGATPFAYRNEFEAWPWLVHFFERTAGSTPVGHGSFVPVGLTNPVVEGPQTAVVVGPENEEIWTDKYGRIKVQFHWDRKGESDENSSCWVRVAQVWAGKRWGAQFIPRIGQEVIVEFLDGDPDCPVVVGSLYNADQMPPYLGDGLDSKHKNDPKVSGIKTNSTPDGKGFNELRFDDTKGKEQLFLHAQRSMDVRVGGSHRHTVGGSHHVNIGYEDEEGGKHGDLRVKVKKNYDLTVETDHNVAIKGACSVDITGGVDRIVGDYVAEDIADEWSVRAKTIIFDATQAICFTVGANTVVIDQTGVTVGGTKVVVEGTTVLINCGTPVVSPIAVHNPAIAIVPEDPDGADGSKSGFPSKPQKGGEEG